MERKDKGERTKNKKYALMDASQALTMGLDLHFYDVSYELNCIMAESE